MQLTYLKIQRELFGRTLEEQDNLPLIGEVEFSGTTGKMHMNLTSKDIENIQQLLMSKTKDLASEV